MLIIALDLGLGREVVHLGPEVTLQPAQEALDLLLLLLVHLQHPLRQESQQVVHHVRRLLPGDEIARCIFGQEGIDTSKDLIELPCNVKLLQLRHQAGALGSGGGGIDKKMNSMVQERLEF